MAPLCSDPRQIIISLDPTRRQALLKLVDDITSHMISQLDTSSGELGAVITEDLDENENENAKEKDQEKDGNQGDDSTGPPQNDQSQKPDQKDQKPPKPSGKASKQAQRIQKAALKHMSSWKKEFMPKLEEVVRVEDTPKIEGERKARLEALQKKKSEKSQEDDGLIDFGGVKINESEDIASVCMLYEPVPTGLTALPVDDRQEALCCVLLLLLLTGKYSAHSRALILYLASALELSSAFVNIQEAEIAKSLLESSADDKNKQEAMSAEAEAAKRRHENKFSRFWKVGLASVAGAAVIGVTGGLAAPLVAGALGGVLGGVGLGGVASFIGIFWMNGALVGALFGAYGAKMTGEMMDSYAKEVEDFKFISLKEESLKDDKSESKSDDPNNEKRPQEKEQKSEQKQHQEKEQEQDQRRLRVTIGINGWLNSEDDVIKPWLVMNSETEVFALRYEMQTLLALGTAMGDLVSSFAWQTFKSEIIKRTVLATLWAALWPIQVLTAASNVDNPFSRASNRSRKAGTLLADALINKVPGERPVTLVGFSLGATVIHACLQSLAERHAFGLVDTVVIIGAPAPSSPAHWRTLRTVVSGKIFNVYSENDMVLGFIYRMHSLAMGVAGLQAVEGVEGLENLNLSGSVSGHLRYASLTGEILRRCGFLGVKAGNEIEKDDVIKMKDEHAEGKLVDVDDAVKNAGKVEDGTDGKVANDLSGMKMPSSEEPNPPLPKRPSKEEAEPESPALPKRPADPDAAGQPVHDIVNSPTPRRPVGSFEKGKDNVESVEAQRQPAPSNVSDDKALPAINMKDMDSD